MQKLFFVRHGESVANEQRICAGHLDVELTELGKQQARVAAEEAQDYDLIVCSPLKRALDTAMIIASKIHYPSEDIIVNELFIERFRGDLEGQPAHLQDGLTDDDFYMHGAERESQLAERVRSAYDWLRSRPEHNILVVSHNQFGRAFVAEITGRQMNDIDKLPNAHIFEINITR